MSEREEHFHRLLGVRDGLAHALVSVNALRGHITGPNGAYLPPQRHTLKRAAAETRVADFDAAAAVIRRQLNDVLAALRKLQQTQKDAA